MATITDSCNRADASTLGSTDTGQTWSASAGTWGIASNKARLLSDTANAIALFDAGGLIESIESTITLDSTLTVAGLVVRSDFGGGDYVWLEIGRSSGIDALSLRKKIGATVTTIASSTTGMTVGGTHVVEVVITDFVTYEVVVDGTPMFAVTDDDLVDAHHAGWFADEMHAGRNTSTRFDDLTVVAAVHSLKWEDEADGSVTYRLTRGGSITALATYTPGGTWTARTYALAADFNPVDDRLSMFSESGTGTFYVRRFRVEGDTGGIYYGAWPDTSAITYTPLQQDGAGGEEYIGYDAGTGVGDNAVQWHMAHGAFESAGTSLDWYFAELVSVPIIGRLSGS